MKKTSNLIYIYFNLQLQTINHKLQLYTNSLHTMQNNDQHKSIPSDKMLDILSAAFKAINFKKTIQVFTRDLQRISIEEDQIVLQKLQNISNIQQHKITKNFQITSFINKCKEIDFIQPFITLKNNILKIQIQEDEQVINTQRQQKEDEVGENEFITKEVQQYANQIQKSISQKHIQYKKEVEQDEEPKSYINFLTHFTYELFERTINDKNQLIKAIQNLENLDEEHEQEIEQKVQILNENDKIGIELQQMKAEIQGQKNDKIKIQLQQMKNKETKEFIEAKLKQTQLKQIFIKKMINLLQRRQNEAIKITFDSFKVGKSDNSFEEKQQRSKVRSGSSKRRSEQSQQFNMQLTMKTKHQKNLFNYSKQDSLMYSNESSFVEKSISPQKKKEEESVVKVQRHSASNRTTLVKIDEANGEQPAILSLLNKSESNRIFNSIPFQQENLQQDKDIVEKQQRSREQKQQIKQQKKLTENPRIEKRENRKRVETEIQKPRNNLRSRNSHHKFTKVNNSRISIDSSNTNIFATQMQNYQSKISRIRQTKELKKKRLQQELEKVNKQIETLKKKQESAIGDNSDQNLASRVEMNNQALVRAQSFVRNLRSDKRNRALAKLGQFKDIDHNINDYMEELLKMRIDNQNKLKQKKKLQILDRMKHKEIQKANQRLKKEENIKFVLHLKNPQKIPNDVTKKSPTKRTQVIIDQVTSPTPELSSKKAYLNKIRNFSIKKSKPDIYEQALS